MKLALAQIIKGVKEEAEPLARCLANISPYVDGIFLTLTHKPGETIAPEVYNVARMYDAVISEFEWVNDFAQARNFSFQQVPKDFDYILWLDADDVVRGGRLIRPTIEDNPDVDAFTLFYLYAFDEHKNPTIVHHKTRIVKNDGCVTWAGKLHEDFHDNRQLNRFHIKGIEVLHFSTSERFEVAGKRNYEIALEDVASNPENPRSYWNAGNSCFPVGKLVEAMQYFDEFLKRSNSDEEKYICRLRRSEVFDMMGDKSKALDEARYAVGLKNEYPDAFHLLGKLFYSAGRYEEAKDMFLNGLARPAPYYKIVVYNPREYDYVPLMNLAKTYYALNLPQLALPCFERAAMIVPLDESLKKVIKILKKEAREGDEVVKMVAKMRKFLDDKKKLKQMLDKVPKKFQYHPEVLRIRNTNFQKVTSSGKDLVVFCGYTKEEWTPESIAKKGSGGSEEAIVTLTEGLASKGWNVTVYNNCGTNESWHDGILYKPYMAWNYRDKQDVVIIWRNPGMCKYEINAPKVFLDMHDVISSGEFTDERLAHITKVFFKSQYHRKLFPNIPDEKVVVIPNGIHPEIFDRRVKKDDKLIINTSSPVRSLSALCDIMEEVRKEIPDVKCKWAYGWVTTDGGMEQEQKYPEWKAHILKRMKEAGIEDVGRLNAQGITDLYLQANLFVYPTGFPEIDCISLTKAQAAGAYPIVTDFAALGGKQAYGGSFIHLPNETYDWVDMSIKNPKVKKQFIKEIVSRLKHPPKEIIKLDAKKDFDWAEIINTWHSLMES